MLAWRVLIDEQYMNTFYGENIEDVKRKFFADHLGKIVTYHTFAKGEVSVPITVENTRFEQIQGVPT